MLCLAFKYFTQDSSECSFLHVKRTVFLSRKRKVLRRFHSYVKIFIVLLFVLFCLFIYFCPSLIHMKIQLPKTLLLSQVLVSIPRPFSRLTTYLIWKGVHRIMRPCSLDTSTLDRMLETGRTSNWLSYSKCIYLHNYQHYYYFFFSPCYFGYCF